MYNRPPITSRGSPVNSRVVASKLKPVGRAGDKLNVIVPVVLSEARGNVKSTASPAVYVWSGKLSGVKIIGLPTVMLNVISPEVASSSVAVQVYSVCATTVVGVPEMTLPVNDTPVGRAGVNA